MFPGTSYRVLPIYPAEEILYAGCTLESLGVFKCAISQDSLLETLFELGWGGPRHLYYLTSPPGDSDMVAGVENHNFLGHTKNQSQDYVVLGLRSKAL